MNNLALAYSEAGTLDLALPLLRETLEGVKAKLGPDHPFALVSSNNLADVFLKMENPTDAMPLYEEAALGMERIRFQHQHAVLIVNNLIANYERLSQFEQA